MLSAVCPVSFGHGPDHSVDESSECCTPHRGCNTPRSVAPGRPRECGIRHAPLAAAERFCGSTTYWGLRSTRPRRQTGEARPPGCGEQGGAPDPSGHGHPEPGHHQRRPGSREDPGGPQQRAGTALAKALAGQARVGLHPVDRDGLCGRPEQRQPPCRADLRRRGGEQSEAARGAPLRGASDERGP